MSDQLNTPQEEQEEQQARRPEATAAVQPAAEQAPPVRREPGFQAPRALDDDEDDDDYDDEEEDEEDESEEDELYVSGPAEYVQREKSGRGRRIGNEVRPEDVDYKNIPLLSRFLDRRGRILSRRKTRVSAKVQRRIVRAIKRARHLALLPYTADQTRIVRKRR
ncbi:MAG TPA: 30S ribosomal protein S18 [Caldilineaceae bacterium]|nr:30S ribosomal protein S18 [Caldilineaceae bacterium]